MPSWNLRVSVVGTHGRRESGRRQRRGHPPRRGDSRHPGILGSTAIEVVSREGRRISYSIRYTMHLKVQTSQCRIHPLDLHERGRRSGAERQGNGTSSEDHCCERKMGRSENCGTIYSPSKSNDLDRIGRAQLRCHQAEKTRISSFLLSLSCHVVGAIHRRHSPP